MEGKGSELIKLKKQIQLVWLETANRAIFLYLLEHGRSGDWPKVTEQVTELGFQMDALRAKGPGMGGEWGACVLGASQMILKKGEVASEEAETTEERSPG